ncbi:hypothetical protein NDU88_003499 [Pleurodeles waltl]|uniref:Uncharacterized protein n=1 Tax=Pleurodeles waltl TaxID=8319 RepID=A0AAV7NPW1_PLEWA|nr:hypothetical protein NDU88_003499 [Pleurodeles waltl]
MSGVCIICTGDFDSGLFARVVARAPPVSRGEVRTRAHLPTGFASVSPLASARVRAVYSFILYACLFTSMWKKKKHFPVTGVC